MFIIKLYKHEIIPKDRILVNVTRRAYNERIVPSQEG